MQSMSWIIFLFNFSVTVWAMAKTDGGRSNFVDIYGPELKTCARLRVDNTLFHLWINVLSTMLLGASNYCAQLLLAPTRDQIDEAHGRQKWLDIGIQSFRNLRRVGFVRQVVWVSLMISSGLLHLL